jgi:hypothetical protein
VSIPVPVPAPSVPRGLKAKVELQQPIDWWTEENSAINWAPTGAVPLAGPNRKHGDQRSRPSSRREEISFLRGWRGHVRG